MCSKPNFPEECLETILSQLEDGQDMLACTLVSQNWNELIGSTRTCMKKIKLRLILQFSTLDRILKFLTNSDRKYECVELRGHYSEALRKCLSAKGRKWTHICFENLHFRSAWQALSCLQIFKSSAEKIVLNRGKFEESFRQSIPSSDLQFP